MDTDATWYERNSLQVKLLQFLIYHLKKNGVKIAPNKPPPPPTPRPVRKLEKTTVSFD